MGDQVVASIVIPVHNTEPYLAACLDSVLAQTERDIEVILVDDGSTDGSLAIEHAYAARDPRIRVIEQENRRQGAARNRGIAAARGTYLYLLDSDDLIAPELVETCVAICEADDLDFMTFDTAGFHEDPEVERPELFKEVTDRAGHVEEVVFDGPAFWSRYCRKEYLPYVCWLEFFRRDFVLREGLTFEEGIFYEDNDWILRVFLAARRMRYVPLKLHRYRDRPGSTAHSGLSWPLADCCPRIHQLLLDLYMKQTTPERRSMVSDVGGGICRWFIGIRDLEPDEDHVARFSSLAATLQEAIADPQLPMDVRQWHLRAYLSLARGVSLWPSGPLSIDRDLLVEVLIGMPFASLGNGTVAVYGTGTVCRLLLKALGEPGLPDLFLETGEPREESLMGRPVMCVRDATDQGIDAVIIASTAYAQEMEDACRELLGEDVRIARVSRAVLSLSDDGKSPGVIIR